MPPLPRQLLLTAGQDLGLELRGRLLKLGLVLRAPLPAVEQGLATRGEQGHEIFRHHRCGGHGAGHGQVELAAAALLPPGEFNALAAQLHALPQPQALGHCFNGLGFAPHGIHQGQLRLGEGNGDG